MKLKRFVAGILSVVMLFSTIPVSAVQTPESNALGPMGAGPFHQPALFVKAEFYNPSDYKVGATGFETHPVLGKTFSSRNDRALFEKATTAPVMKPIDTGVGKLDSRELSQMYLMGKTSMGHENIRFLVEGNNAYLTKAVTRHTVIPTSNVSGAGTQKYKDAAGILTLNNVYMTKLLSVTNNGKDWDGDKISAALTELWETYVSDKGSKVNSTEAVNYRVQFASMYMRVDNNDATFVAASNYLTDLFTTKIKSGQTPPGASFKIEDAEQAANIQNLMMANLALVLGNPVAGLTIKGNKVSASNGYKGTTILNKLLEWAKAGGNSDASDKHFAIRVEPYANKEKDNTLFDRWDYSFKAGSNGGSVAGMSAVANFSAGKSSKDYYGFDGDYTTPTAGKYFTKSMESIIAYNKALGSAPKRKSGSGTNEPYVSWWTMFQQVILNKTGGINSDASNSKGNVRGACEFKSAGYFEGKRTVALGFNYLAPVGVHTGNASSVAAPNFKLDGRAYTDAMEVAKGLKGEAKLDLNFKHPGVYGSTRDKYKLVIPTEQWRSPSDELNNILLLADRASDASQIASGAENKLLPTTVTIKRSIVNGKSSTDKIIDDSSKASSKIQTGPYGFKILSDDGNTAVIQFNLLPSGASGKEYRIISPRLKAAGKTSEASYAVIKSDAIASLFESGEVLSLKDADIDVTDDEEGITTVNYDISLTVKAPSFKENVKAYGPAATDTVKSKTNYVGQGYRILPENNAFFPASDWTSSRTMSTTIRRTVTFKRTGEVPVYSNYGYENKTPYFAEIKEGSPSDESFEAMSGVPQTESLYTSVGATDFRVEFIADKAEKTNSAGYRTYTYVFKTSSCIGNNESCASTCPGHKQEDGSILKHETLECGAASCNHKPRVNKYHPESHTFTYVVKVPIEQFTYFDMKDTEVWRLSQWGLKNSSDDVLKNGDVTKKLSTKFWGFNIGDYKSGNGRIAFTNAMNSNENGEAGMFGDCKRTFNVSSQLTHAEMVAKAVELTNNAKNAEPAFTGHVVSDFVVLETSEGYQVPYYNSYKFDTTAKTSSAPNFTNTQEGGTVTTSDTLKVNKLKTIDDFWWKNSDKSKAATKGNGWTNTSITYGGYNGDYKNLNDKYVNTRHKNFLSSSNPLDSLFSTVRTERYPNMKTAGSGGVSFGSDEDNNEHIVTGLKINRLPNGEYNTGNAWLRYDRVMFYRNNSDKGASSSTQGTFKQTDAGVYVDNNIPYYKGADKINDIVIHDPVSAENAIVVSNPSSFDLRTNAKLLQGGDPIGLSQGICPLYGCEYSTLTCTTPLHAHTAACYANVEDTISHDGGFNTHVHTDACYHKHNDNCRPTSYSWIWAGCKNHSGSATTNSPNPPSYKECGVGHWELKTTSGSGGVGSYKCDGEACMATGKHKSSKCPYNHSCNGCGPCHTCENGNLRKDYSCGYTEGQLVCTNDLNKHVCTDKCKTTYKKVLICDDPHHYTPGEPTNRKDPKFHHPKGDPRCWTRCGDDARHGTPTSVKLPDGSSAKMGGTFINLDREFKIYFPFNGDFSEDPSLEGISSTTKTRGKGYENDMNTKKWTAHRWVKFPFNVLDKNNKMILANTQIDLNDYSTSETTFTFYCSLSNSEASATGVKFTATANNAPVDDDSAYFDDSDDITNKERVNSPKAANHSASKIHHIDIVGSIGGLTIEDTGDIRFANLFKQPETPKSWLIPNVIPKVDLRVPNYVVGDFMNVKQDEFSKVRQWLDSYGLLSITSGGRSGGTENSKQPLTLPLTPDKNNITALKKQPMRPGYNLYMDVETQGNYYGESLSEKEGKFLDNQMVQKMQIRPMYYSMNLDTGKYTPVDVYYGVNGEYMKVNDYHFKGLDNDEVGVKDFYYYLDWLEESARRNYTSKEDAATKSALQHRSDNEYLGGKEILNRKPNPQKDIVGSANVLFLNDLNRTFTGSSKTYNVDKNPGGLVAEAEFNQQAQRWHFTLGLPSSSVFVEAGKPCTDENIKVLQTSNRVIVCSLDIKVLGDVWTLQYNGLSNNSKGFTVGDSSKVYKPPMFDKDGHDTTDPDKDVTSNNIVVVVYPPKKTSADDVVQGGTH